MEVKNLVNVIIILILIGLTVGLGVVCFDKFESSVDLRASLINESITIASGVGETANDELASVTYFGNDTISTNGSILVNSHVNYTAAGAITVDGSIFGDGSYDISYTYDSDTAASTSITNSISALAEIPTTWMGLIVTAIVVILILGLIVGGLMKFNNPR